MARVTLTTDFGTADGYAAAMKGVIFSRCPEAQIVDVTHAVPRHDVGHAAHVLATAAPWFPEGTIHVVVVDPGVGSGRRALVVDDGRQLFVGPDNGVFELIAGGSKAYEIRNPSFVAEEVSMTFHGRDVFAPAAGVLAAGAKPAEAGPQVDDLAGLAPVDEASVIHVDRFGNLITNLRPSDLGGRSWALAGRSFSEIKRTYADAEVGEVFAYVGSAGTIEVAVRDGDAAAALGVGRGARVEVAGV